MIKTVGATSSDGFLVLTNGRERVNWLNCSEGVLLYRSAVFYVATSADLPATADPVGGDAMSGGRRSTPGHLLAQGE